jgi:hypothetical protein
VGSAGGDVATAATSLALLGLPETPVATPRKYAPASAARRNTKKKTPCRAVKETW